MGSAERALLRNRGKTETAHYDRESQHDGSVLRAEDREKQRMVDAQHDQSDSSHQIPSRIERAHHGQYPGVHERGSSMPPRENSRLASAENALKERKKGNAPVHSPLGVAAIHTPTMMSAGIRNAVFNGKERPLTLLAPTQMSATASVATALPAG